MSDCVFCGKELGIFNFGAYHDYNGYFCSVQHYRDYEREQENKREENKNKQNAKEIQRVSELYNKQKCIAHEIYQQRMKDGRQGTPESDWYEARLVIYGVGAVDHGLPNNKIDFNPEAYDYSNYF